MHYSSALIAAILSASQVLAAPADGSGHGRRHRSQCSSKSRAHTPYVDVVGTSTGYRTYLPGSSTSTTVSAPVADVTAPSSAVSAASASSSTTSTSVNFDKKNQDQYTSAWSTAWTSTWTEAPAAPTTTTTSSSTSPSHSSTSVYVAPTTSTSSVGQHAATSTSSGALADSTSSASLIQTINKYRHDASLPTFTWNDTLATNAQDTCNASGGTSLTHHLYPGSYGQVMVYGATDDIACGESTDGQTSFGLAWYSWLCEYPSGAGLGAEFCKNIYAASNIDNEGQTGHYEILSSSSYSQIGCGFYANPKSSVCDKFAGVWTCDVA